MGSSSSKKKDIFSEDGEYVKDKDSSEYTRKKIVKIKKVNVNEDLFTAKKDKIDKNAKTLNELNKKDEFDKRNCHEYMFFPVKNKDKDKMEQIAKIKKLNKKSKDNELYTFNKEHDIKRQNDLNQLLHIEYNVKEPINNILSIKKLPCDKPPPNKGYLIIEYNVNKKIEGENSSEENEESSNMDIGSENILNKKYKTISRVVHTNNPYCKIANYDYTKENGERYDYLHENNDTKQVRKLKGRDINDKQNDDEEKKVKLKEENEENFRNKRKKKEYECKKMI